MISRSKIVDKRYQAIKNGLEWIRKNTSIGEDGSIRSPMTIAFNIARELIIFNIPFEESIPDRTRRIAVSHALRRWLKYKKYSDCHDKVSSFIEALELETRIMERSLSSYSVMMFLNAKAGEIFDSDAIRLQGDTLQFPSWRILSTYDVDELWNRVHSHDPKHPLIWSKVGKNITPNRSIFTPVIVDV